MSYEPIIFLQSEIFGVKSSPGFFSLLLDFLPDLVRPWLGGEQNKTIFSQRWSVRHLCTAQYRPGHKDKTTSVRF